MDNKPKIQIKELIKLMRPKQWVKNSFVFAPLIFSGEFLNLTSISHTLLAMLIFCIASSAAYTLNDIHDFKLDRLHPKKSKTRPIAALIVTKSMATAFLILLYIIIAYALFLMPEIAIVITLYLVLNIAYTFTLKYQPIIDIFTIAIGFVLRVYAGALALSVSVSSWMFITTFCLALFLASIKRKQELILTGSDGRIVLKKYSAALVNRFAEMSSIGALIFYSMFVMSSKPQLIISIPLVIFGLFRYWYIVEKQDCGESPTDTLLADRHLLAVVFLWVTVCIWALWPTQG